MFRFSFALRRKRTAVTPLPSRLRRATFPNREGFLSSVNYNLPILISIHNGHHCCIHRGIHAVPGRHGPGSQQYLISGSGPYLICRHDFLTIAFHYQERLSLEALGLPGGPDGPHHVSNLQNFTPP